jgi:hypothetical protein
VLIALAILASYIRALRAKKFVLTVALSYEWARPGHDFLTMKNGSETRVKWR